MLKLAIRYGAMIAAALAIWVIADHFWLHISQPGSRLSILTPIFFNLAEFAVLFLGLRDRREQLGGRLRLGDGVAAGMAISLAYAIFASIFFGAFYALLGSKLLENESTAFGNSQPQSRVLIGAFAGLFFGALFGGLLYSAVLSLALGPKRAD